MSGVDQFILASTWDSEEDALRTAGDPDQPKASEVLSGIATIDSMDVYSVIGPPFRGIVDAPGGVIRVTTARVPLASRDEMLGYLAARSRDRARSVERLVLGWCLAERPIDDEVMETIAVSVWPSPLVIEAVAESGRTGSPLSSDVDSFASDAHVEQFRAISLELPDDLADIGSRRLIAARFKVRETAEATAAELSSATTFTGDAETSVAPLGEPGTASDVRSFLLVARVSISDYLRAERLIEDRDGEVIMSQLEMGEGGAAGASDSSDPEDVFSATQ